MSLLTACTNALTEIGGFQIPSSFYGSTDATARQCVSLVVREGMTLEREHRWSSLITSTTITTVSGTASYALPSDFRAFANMSQWDRTNSIPLIGPTTAHTWQFLKSGLSASATINRWFRVQNGYIYIHPTPSSADTLAYDYYSKSWIIKQADSSYVSAFNSDNDTLRLDEELVTLGLKWRFLQAKGMPYQPEYAEYEAIKTELYGDDGGRGMINLGRPFLNATNLPDTNFGS